MISKSEINGNELDFNKFQDIIKIETSKQNNNDKIVYKNKLSSTYDNILRYSGKKIVDHIIIMILKLIRKTDNIFFMIIAKMKRELHPKKYVMMKMMILIIWIITEIIIVYIKSNEKMKMNMKKRYYYSKKI